MKTRVILSLALAASALWLAPHSAIAQTASSGPKKVEVVEVFDARVTLIDDVRVPAQEAGRLMKVLVKGGELVDEGSVLAEVDNRDTLAKQKIAQGERDVAEAQAESDAELEVALKAVDVSQAELDANEEIRAKNPGAVSLTEIRKLRFQLDRAKAQVRVAKVDRNVAALTTKLKEAQLEATANELARRQITAPFKGEVNEVFRQVGEWVQPGEPIVHLARFDRMRVMGMAYWKESAPVDVIGKPVEIVVTTAGNKQKTVKGKIDFASSIVDGTGDSRTYRIWTEVENEKVVDPLTKRESWAIQPGLLATMTIDLTPPLAVKPAPPVKAAPGNFRSRLPGATGTGATGTSAPGSEKPAAEKIESLKPVSNTGSKQKER